VQIDHALEWLQATRIASTIGENEILFPWIESVHVLAIVLVVGTISIVDLRLLGVASRQLAVRRVMRDVIPYTWGAFAVAALTGSLLFSSDAVHYAHNRLFQAKLVLLARHRALGHRNRAYAACHKGGRSHLACPVDRRGGARPRHRLHNALTSR
jgi:hypothetical protein